jgi:hypothetical protein
MLTDTAHQLQTSPKEVRYLFKNSESCSLDSMGAIFLLVKSEFLGVDDQLNRFTVVVQSFDASTYR